MTTTDLLYDLIWGRSDGVIVDEDDFRSLPETQDSVYVYGSGGAAWRVEEDTIAAGDAQNGKTKHLRTCRPVSQGGAARSTRYHRTIFGKHRLLPRIACTFKVEGWDSGGHYASHGNLGFKMSLFHHSNLLATHLQFKQNGRVSLFAEERDADGYDPANPSGTSIAGAPGAWDPTAGVRHSFYADLSVPGRWSVWLDGAQIFNNVADPSPEYAGQIALRLDGADVSLHSLVIKE